MRYIVGIDLGTTNTCVSYVDTEQNTPMIQQFRIPQVVREGCVEAHSTLPSACYLTLPGEWTKKALDLPWAKDPDYIVGAFAMDHGSRVPSRLVSSAKSWLCHSVANRKDPILPFDSHDSKIRISPVEASRRYLEHIRCAWNHEMAKGDPERELEHQDIVLTVPASFDEVARSLTAEAAKQAGFRSMTFLEEPQAAFYNWLSYNERSCQDTFTDGDRILVCDVGGGTTDFSLIEVRLHEDKVSFERMAVGDHLLLGGDNLDNALAYHLEGKLRKNGHPELSTVQWKQLCHEARRAKEVLLTNKQTLIYTAVIQGSGSSVIADSLTVEVEASEVDQLLVQGFFPVLSYPEAIHLKKNQGLRTMGLPYEEDPCITKQLAHFLHYAIEGDDKAPEFILFNGGTMKGTPFRTAIMSCFEKWCPKKYLGVLEVKNMDLAVSRGAAYYGRVRRGEGVKIHAGSPRSYYLELHVREGEKTGSTKALCLLPRGTQEGTTLKHSTSFHLKANEPVSFSVFTSNTRLHDQQGEIIDIDPLELHRLPPIHTLLRFGKSQNGEQRIPVDLWVNYTTLGTLEIWLASKNSEHRWNLEFQLRKSSGQEDQLSLVSAGRNDETFDQSYLNESLAIIDALFAQGGTLKPSEVIDKLEKSLDKPREKWPPSILRGLFDALIKNSSKRKRSPPYEARWWNLAGYFLRPGYGYPLDDHRVKELWKVVLSDLNNKDTTECSIQKWICFRRLSGGFTRGQQIQLCHQILPTVLKAAQGKQAEYAYSEQVRLIASLELIDVPTKLKFGNALLTRISKGHGTPADFWAIGRLGARHLLYGSSANSINANQCKEWIDKLLDASTKYPLALLSFPLGQLARITDHKEFNVPNTLRDSILEMYKGDASLEQLHRFMTHDSPLTQEDKDQIFGEQLPPGLEVEVVVHVGG